MQTVPLGRLLEQVRVPADIDLDREYKQVTVRMHRRGATLRGVVKGDELGSSQYVVRAGQVIVSRIDARHGAIATITDELDGAVVTNDFWVYDVGNIDRDFLERYFDTSDFRRDCERASSGSTNRVRLQRDRFHAIPIPCPSNRDEQRRLVRQADQRLASVHAAKALAAANQEDAEHLYRAGIRAALVGSPSVDARAVDDLLDAYRERHPSVEQPRANNAAPGVVSTSINELFELAPGWRWVPLAACCTHIVDCINDTPDFEARPTEFLGLKTTNVRANRLVLDEAWYVNEDTYRAWNRRATPRSGDLVLTREAPMGFVCRLPDEPPICLTQRLVLIRTDDEFVSGRYLAHVLNDFLLMDQAGALSKSMPPHLRVRDLPGIAVPLCDRAMQEQLANRLDRLYDATRELTAQITEQLLDLVALERAVLNQTFQPIAETVAGKLARSRGDQDEGARPAVVPAA